MKVVLIIAIVVLFIIQMYTFYEINTIERYIAYYLPPQQVRQQSKTPQPVSPSIESRVRALERAHYELVNYLGIINFPSLDR
jgi:hypothetical protein